MKTNNEFGINETMREELVDRAQSLCLPAFLQSLTPAEYRELTFFWQSAVEFWRKYNPTPNAELDRPTHDAQGRALHYWDADGEFIGPEGLTTQQCCERGIRV